MSVSRGYHLFKTIGRAVSKTPNVNQIRNSGGLYSYRSGAYPPTKLQVIGSNILGGFMWWWVLWHLWHEPDHITGEFPWPDPSKWTDEELGITG